jgi:hypothetical protein
LIPWRELEERSDLAVRELEAAVARARLLQVFETEGPPADSLRVKLAKALVALGARIEPDGARSALSSRGQP